MPKEVVFVGPRQIEVRDYEEHSPGSREVKVRILYSGISHGTEMSHYRDDAIWHHKWVEADGFVREGKSTPYPFTYGYEDVAQIEEIGEAVTEFKEGDVVGCSAHHRESRIFSMEKINLTTDTFFLSLPKPDDGSFERYIFISLGSVALDGLLLAPIRLGESAVIIGQGVVGLLAMQLCKLSGADPVIAVDLFEERLELARRLGADHVYNPRVSDVGQEVRRLLGGHGADVCFEASGRTEGIGLALHCGTPYPKVIALGMYDGPAGDLISRRGLLPQWGSDSAFPQWRVPLAS